MTRAVTAEVHRQPVRVAADWQEAVAEMCRREPHLSPRLVDALKGSGLLGRCCWLITTDGGPLVMRHIAAVTVQILGMAWARAQLGRPHVGDLYRDYAVTIDAEYREAIGAGEVLVNRIALHGIRPTPIIYTQMLVGWSLGRRQAVLSAVGCSA